MFDEIRNNLKKLEKDIKDCTLRVKVLLITVLSVNLALKIVFIILVGVALYVK